MCVQIGALVWPPAWLYQYTGQVARSYYKLFICPQGHGPIIIRSNSS